MFIQVLHSTLKCARLGRKGLETLLCTSFISNVFTEVHAEFLFIHTLGLHLFEVLQQCINLALGSGRNEKREQHPVSDFEVNFILIIYEVGLDQIKIYFSNI